MGWPGVKDEAALGLTSLNTRALVLQNRRELAGGEVENAESSFMAHSVPTETQCVPCG